MSCFKTIDSESQILKIINLLSYVRVNQVKKLIKNSLIKVNSFINKWIILTFISFKSVIFGDV